MAPIDNLRTALDAAIAERVEISGKLNEVLSKVNTLAELLEKARLADALREREAVAVKVDELNARVKRLTELLEKAYLEAGEVEKAHQKCNYPPKET